MSAKPVLLHFKFDDFANLPSEVGSYVYSDVQTDTNGNKWKLRLYPGGEPDALQEYVGVYLRSCNANDIEAKFSITINGGSVDAEESDYGFRMFNNLNSGTWGCAPFEKRSDILDPANKILNNGALCIDAAIQVKPKKDEIFQPPSPLSAKMIKLLKSSEDADVSSLSGNRNSSPTSTLSKPVHLFSQTIATVLMVEEERQ
jgi:hypothetical protein